LLWMRPVGFGAALGSLDVSLITVIWSYADHRRSGEDYFGPEIACRQFVYLGIFGA
jgi:hypothetical protein